MLEHRTFVRFAALFEAGLAVLAVAVGWLVGVQPADLALDSRAVLLGIAGTAPLVGFYFLASWLPLGPLRRIQTLLISTLGRPLSQCRWHELALLACLAGVCEELLFRGVLQPWFSQLGEPVGWIKTNVLFGLAHAVTPTYFVLAGGIGVYFSGLQALADSLVAPIIAHTLYDWFAFVQIARAYRESSEQVLNSGGRLSDRSGPSEPLDDRSDE